ncbi:MAG: hypothetical protein HY518_04775 [Candidatus Aenigmarchaeota archaeon]|nr:hypothetical protein [Candidatus Aenigmarchaeota archaeon]
MPVYMIGVNHLDWNGPNKLARVLEDKQPDRILLEGSQSKDNAQETYRRIQREVLAERQVCPELAVFLMNEQELKGYEGRVARVYCRGRSLPEPAYLNDSFESLTENQIRYMVTRAISHASAMPLGELGKGWEGFQISVRLLYREFQSVIDTPSEQEIVSLLPRHEYWIDRKDAVMERGLRKAVEENTGSVIATITGFTHLISNPKRNSFYCRVRDLSPKRVILFD